MQIIKLTQGKEAFIDDEDYGVISQYKWHVCKDSNNWYACRKLAGQTIRMHRVIMNAQKGQQVDHRNQNGLDNRRKNLRFVSSSQQIQNARKKRDGISQFKGVTWNKIRTKWEAYIYIPKHLILGYFAKRRRCCESI